jgi:predicted aconitase with swiveling domain
MGAVTVTLHGRGVVAGIVEGEALVCPKGIGAFGGLDPRTGVINEYDNVNRGATIKDKILVMPGSKGSNGWSCYFTATWVAGTAPKGWIFTRIDSSAAVAAVILQIPTVVDFAAGEDPCALIQTGDWVRMDGESGVVEVLRAAKAPMRE